MSKSLRWGINTSTYELIYPKEICKVIGTPELKKLIKEKGTPLSFRVSFKTLKGSYLIVDTSKPEFVIIRAHSKSAGLSSVIDVAQRILSLEQIPLKAGFKGKFSSVFIAHSFSKVGKEDASNVAHFLEVLGYEVHSGKTFSPKSISEKVKNGLRKYDIVIGIITPEKDLTWLIQETTAAHTLDKPLFLLVNKEVNLKEGILGDLEYIPFETGRISDTYIHILEGLKELRQGNIFVE